MSRELHTQAWIDENTDLINVKVMLLNNPEEGDVSAWKKGVIVKLTEEQLRYIAEAQTYPTIDSWSNPDLSVEVVPEKTPVYEIGSADPVFFMPGATDCRIFIDGEAVHCAQALDVFEDEGVLLFVGHPGSDWIKALPEGKCQLKVEVASEYGKKEVAYDESVVLGKPRWAISVDDIITEVTIPFCKKEE